MLNSYSHICIIDYYRIIEANVVYSKNNDIEVAETSSKLSTDCIKGQ